jgi:DNA-binding transcriptional regulator GbsR (MarR family)
MIKTEKEGVHITAGFSFKATKKNFAIDKDNIEYMSTIKKENLNYYIDMDDKLYKKLTSDLTKDPASNEIQQIASKIVSLTDEKYGKGACKFIGKAFKFYAENNK